MPGDSENRHPFDSDMAKKIRDTEGRPVLKEPHDGARKRTRDDIKNAKKQRR